MKNAERTREVWKAELYKASRSKGFRIAIIIGIIISVMQTIWFYRNVYSMNQEDYRTVMSLSTMDEGYGIWFEKGIMEGWLGCEVYSMYNQLYFTIFPLLAVMAYGLSFYNEWKSGYAGQLIVRCGRRCYLCAKFGVVFLTGGFVVVFPLLVNLITTACYLPAIGVDPLSMQAIVANRDIFSYLYYEMPILYAICYLGVDFIYGGIFACFTLVCSRWFSNRFAAALFPFVLYSAGSLGLTSLFPQMNVYNVFIHINPAQVYGTDQLAVLSFITVGILILITVVYCLNNWKTDIIE